MGSPMYLSYDGARVSTESPLGKELMKWERKPDWTPEGNPFPAMLYRAMNRQDGRRSIGEVRDDLCGGWPGAAEQWTRRCQLTVKNEDEQRKAFENGWRKTPQEALDYLEAQENAKSNLTAERHYTDARMSVPAQREAAAVDQSTLKQIPVIPEQPLPGPRTLITVEPPTAGNLIVRTKRKYVRKADKAPKAE